MDAESIRSRTFNNLDRVGNLVFLYRNLAGRGQGRQPVHSTDVLRAATVFLHAALEDFLRTLSRWKLPTAGREIIDDVPLIGTGDRASKFHLGSLVAHRGKLVDDLIRASVEAHLERSNYGNVGEVKDVLTKIGLDPNQLNADYGGLAKLMERRHQIVHRADRNEVGGRGQHRATAINPNQVQEWKAVVEQFVNEVLGRLV